MASLDDAQQLFESDLPHLRDIAASYFAHLGPEGRDESVQNVIFLTWLGFAPLVERDMANHDNLRACLSFAIRQHRSGRRAGRLSDTPRDLMDIANKGGNIVVAGDININLYIDPWHQAIPDMVAFKIDTPEWLEWLGPEWSTRAIDLSQMTTGDIAAKHGVTSGAVSQWRTRLNVLWKRFHGE